MSIYRGPGGAGDAVADSSSEALLVRQLAVEVAADAAEAEAARAAAVVAKNAAETAETNAETAETNAETAETNAETAATAAASSASSASSSATAASTSATNAASSASSASTSASSASTSATNAASSATSAASSATSATSSKNAAATSATNAASSATSAASSATSAAASYDSFDDRYLGSKTSAPSVDNDGNSLLTGALYFNSVAGEMFVWNGSSWVTVANSTSATNAANSATAAATSATNAANSATAAATSATNAANSATSASTSASTASTAATTATTQATNAATSATSASTSATNAATSATNAASSATSASASAAAASAVALGNEPVRHSVRPSLLLDFANTKTLDPRITFTRASTGTYYDGKTVAKAEENLFLQSETFDSASWDKTNSIVTANSVASPDGTTTAETITDNSTSGNHNIFQTITFSTGSCTFSVYAKYLDHQWIGVRIGVPGNQFFGSWDILNGVVGSATAGATISIQSLSGGWYRLVLTANLTSSGSANAIISLNNTDATSLISYVGTGTSAYIWGAQLEQRSTVTAYTATTTARITNYIPALQTAASGVARFEHNPVTGESLGLEIEEQRTNLSLQSQDFTTTWGYTRGSALSNVVIAPDGTLTADKLIDTTDTGTHFAGQAITTTAASHTFSVFAKAAELSYIMLYHSQSISGAVFNLSNGTIGSSTGTLTSNIQAVGNGWYRCSITSLATAASNAYRIYLGVTGSLLESYTGDGYKGVYVWGAQLEAGSFATSYIPTVASQVTRSADSASMTGTNFSSWYRADEGSIYYEAVSPALSTSTRVFEVHLNGSGGTQSIASTFSASQHLTVNIPGATQCNIDAGTFTAGSFGKLAVAYKVNDFAASINAGTVGTDTLGTLPTVNEVIIGSNYTNISGKLNGTIKKLAYYPKRLPNAELQGLTTV